MPPVLLSADATLLDDRLVADTAIAAENGTIVAIGKSADMTARYRGAERIDLANHALLPGLVNAHQHGEGLTSIQFGYPDDFLELWLARFRRREAMDPYGVTLLGALEMIANGVTATIQANTPYGTGDFTGEIRSFARAYEAAGLRAMVGIGSRDRAELVYPEEKQAEFITGLPAELRELVGNPKAFILYAGDAAATIAVMDRLQEEYRNHPLISFAYAPAGPQWVSDTMLRTLAADAARRGAAIHMHGLESHAQALALSQEHREGFLKHLEGLGVLSERLSLAHAVWLTDDDAHLAAQYKVTLVRNPGSNLRLRAGIAPLGQYLRAGVNVALGSDSTTLHDDEDLFKELRLATGLARSPMWDGFAPLTTRDMVEISTIAGARAMGQGTRTGRIEVGRRADIIAVSLERVRGAYLDPDIDLTTALYARALGSDVRLTMIEGRIVYRDGTFPHLDREKIAAEVAADAARTRITDREVHRKVEALTSHLTAYYQRRHQRLRQAPWQPIAERDLWT